jgi:hypothetical protein
MVKTYCATVIPDQLDRRRKLTKTATGFNLYSRLAPAQDGGIRAGSKAAVGSRS